MTKDILGVKPYKKTECYPTIEPGDSFVYFLLVIDRGVIRLRIGRYLFHIKKVDVCPRGASEAHNKLGWRSWKIGNYAFSRCIG